MVKFNKKGINFDFSVKRNNLLFFLSKQWRNSNI